MKLFGKKEKKAETPKDPTTIDLALEFSQRAVNVINAQLAKEIERCGFKVEDVKSGALALTRKVQIYSGLEVAGRNMGAYKTENFIIGSTVVMAVKWLSNGFSIDVNNEAAINKMKDLRAGVGATYIELNKPVIDLTAKYDERELQIEKLASEYEAKHNELLGKAENLGRM